MHCLFSYITQFIKEEYLNIMHKFIYFISLYFLLFTFCSCANSDNNAKKNENNPEDTTKPVKREPAPLIEYPQIDYTVTKIHSTKELNSILTKYDSNKEDAKIYRKILRTLNRKELRFIRVGETIIVPNTVVNDICAYSIFPYNYQGAEDLPKLVMIDNEYQAYACYEYGRIVRFAACNTGKQRTPTFPGRYSFVWKQKVRNSSLDSTWIMPWTFNFHQYAGNAMHEFVMPGRPVSHSCVRQFGDDAEWIYKWGKGADYDGNRRAIPNSGNPVIILNMFDYTRPKGGPWLELTSNKAHFVTLPEKPMDVEEALIPWCQIPKASRGVIPNAARYKSAEDTLRARGIIKPGVVLTETVDFNKLRRDKAKQKQDSIAKISSNIDTNNPIK